jgi:hypothetical protein
MVFAELVQSMEIRRNQTHNVVPEDSFSLEFQSGMKVSNDHPYLSPVARKIGITSYSVCFKPGPTGDFLPAYAVT